MSYSVPATIDTIRCFSTKYTISANVIDEIAI